MNNYHIKYAIILFFIISFIIFSVSLLIVFSDSTESSENNEELTEYEFHENYIDFYIQLNKFDFITNNTREKIYSQHIEQQNISLNYNLKPITPFENKSNTIMFGSYNESEFGIITQINKSEEDIHNILNNQTNITKTHEDEVIYLENSEFNMEYVTLLNDNYIALSDNESYINKLIEYDEKINISSAAINNNSNVLLEFNDVKTLYNDTLSYLNNSENNNHKLINDLLNNPQPEKITLYKNESKLTYTQRFDTRTDASRFNFMLDNYDNSNIDVDLNLKNINISYKLQKESFNEYIKKLSDKQYESDIIDINERDEFINITVDSETNEYDEINVIHNNEIIKNISDINQTTNIELENKNYTFEGISENGTTDEIKSTEEINQSTTENDDNINDDEDNIIEEDENNETEDSEDIENTTEISKEETNGNITITIEENQYVDEFRIIDPDAMSQTIGSDIGNSEELIEPEGEYRIIGILDDGSEELIKTINP